MPGSEVLAQLTACVIRPLETSDWWHKTLAVVESLMRDTPCYVMRFDKSGAIVDRLLELTA